MTSPANNDDRRRTGGGTIPLGRYAGIPARAHWSLLVILVLLTQILAVSLLPSALPGRTPAAYWLVGAAAALTFLASIMAHEFAHALTARRHGIEAKHVTLWLLGGVTELGAEPKTPRAEAAIAAAGPAASLALGGVFAGLTWVFAGPGLAAVALGWLAAVNVLLGVFNLLPGAPLDGGRILRALLWWRYRDRARAAAGSARAGTLLGMAVMALGMVQLFAGAIVGIWLALIGWFLMTAAGAERVAAFGSRLAGRQAGEFMTAPPNVVPSWWTVAAFAGHLRDDPAAAARIGAMPMVPLVGFDGSPSGLLRVRDLQRVRADDRDTVRLRELSAGKIRPLVVAPDTPAEQVMVPMRAHGGVAVVVDAGHVVGTIDHAALAAAAELAALSGPDSAPAPPNGAGRAHRSGDGGLLAKR